MKIHLSKRYALRLGPENPQSFLKAHHQVATYDNAIDYQKTENTFLLTFSDVIAAWMITAL